MKNIMAILVLISWTVFALSHGGEKHSEKDVEGKSAVVTESQEKLFSEINQQYLTRVKPIFQKKCLDCHGTGNEKPWYYAIPGPKQLINHDIEEAKEHLDMSKDFPFGGHGDPEEDLEELEEVVEDDSMPPWQYKIMHWSSSLTENEKKTVKDWIKKSLTSIKQGDVE